MNRVRYAKESLAAFSAKCVGMVYGEWTITAPPSKHPTWGTMVIAVKCACGAEASVEKSKLLQGRTRMCRLCSESTRVHNRAKSDDEICSYDMAKLRAVARQRVIPVSVSVDYLTALFASQGKKCALSGVELSLGARKRCSKRRIGKTASLDRIDSSRGYVEGNVQWVHKDINIAKASLSNEEFVSMCAAVVKNAGYTIT